MHLNIQGLSKKINSLEIVLDEYKPDFMCITEHWLKAHEINMISIHNYEIVNSFCRKTYDRGGVCIFSKIGLELQPIVFDKCIEKDFEVSLSVLNCVGQISCKLYIVVLYRSPSSSFDAFVDKVYDLLCMYYNKDNFYIICGDLNTDLLCDKHDSRKLVNLFLEFGMYAHVHQPTRITHNSSTCIDVIFSNVNIGIDAGDSNVIVRDTHMSDHTFQIFTFMSPMNFYSGKKEYVYRRDISDDHMLTFKLKLCSQDWSKIYLLDNFQQKFFWFYTTFLYEFDNVFSHKKIRRQAGRNTWFTPELKQLNNMLCELFKISKTTNNAYIKERYKSLKTIYQKKLKSARKNYNNNRLSYTNNVMKESWKIINQHKGCRYKPLPSSFRHNNTTITGSQNICNEFNNFFINSSATNPQYGKLKLQPQSNVTYFLTPTTPQEIQDVISKTTSKPAAGIDEICGTVIKSVSNVIAEPLSFLINESFKNGEYPKDLKVAKVIPIFKNKGSKDEISNYRNVCLPNQLAKIIDMCYYTRLCKFIESNNLMNNCQHGFRPKRSTESALAELCQFVYKALNNQENSIAIMFDLSRAFDTIDHKLLLEKLQRMVLNITKN
nr:unnamed protein product [Callosobruchus chinensis]